MRRRRTPLLARELPLSLLLALRYLKSARRDAFVTFLSVVAGGGIALGVAALILSLAALSGFQQALRGEILARTPQLEIELPATADPAAVRREVAAVPGVEGTQLLVAGRGWLVSRGRVQAAELVGFAGSVPESFPGAAGGPPGLYLSDHLAQALGLETGDVVEVASTRPVLTPFGPQPRLRRLPLAGTFASGRTAEEERVALPLAAAESLVGTGGRRLIVGTAGLEPALALAPRLRTRLGPAVTVRTWHDLNRGLFFALRLEKSVMFLAVSLIIVVAALALLSDLALIITRKRPEIGMLGAMGAAPDLLRRTFLVLGALLASTGTGAGAVLGLSTAWTLERFHLLRLPGQVYFLDYVPFLVRGTDLAAVIGTTTVLALLCALYGAQRAATLDPVEALRR